MALYRTRLNGKSRQQFWKRGADPINRWVKLTNIVENATFVLPANVALTGRVIIHNPSASTQAAITIGTAAAGTQIDSGATLATLLSTVRAGTKLDPTDADRTIYVESAAWQTAAGGVHVLLEAIELPRLAQIDNTVKA